MAELDWQSRVGSKQEHMKWSAFWVVDLNHEIGRLSYYLESHFQAGCYLAPTRAPDLSKKNAVANQYSVIMRGLIVTVVAL
jgi:hypothetical protein